MLIVRFPPGRLPAARTDLLGSRPFDIRYGAGSAIGGYITVGPGRTSTAEGWPGERAAGGGVRVRAGDCGAGWPPGSGRGHRLGPGGRDHGGVGTIRRW